jgi:hypothetical protein
MTSWLFNQYQAKTEAPPSLLLVQQLESAWHQPWSIPVRFQIAPGLVVALAASGMFAPPLLSSITKDNPAVNEAMWHLRWLDPVRMKPGLSPGLQQSFTESTVELFSPQLGLEGWFNWFSDPVRTKPGLGTWLQQFLAHHPRTLPTPNVTVTIAARETNTDSALIAVNVVQSSTTGTGQALSASVSIVEVFVGQSGTSIAEH